MASQILIAMDDLETAVRLNAAFEAAKFSTAMFSSLDDARGTVRRESPELVILTGAVHEPHVQQLPRWRTTRRSPPSPCWSRPTRSGPSGWGGSAPPRS